MKPLGIWPNSKSAYRLLWCGALLVINACATPPTPQVVAGKGVDSLRVIGAGRVAVYAQRGIGRVNVDLAADDALELYLHYEEGRPLLEPEGVVLLRADGMEAPPDAALENAGYTVRFLPQAKAMRWQLLFIDYYR